MSIGPTGTARVATSARASGPTGADATGASKVTAPVTTPVANTDPHAPPKLLRPSLATGPTGAYATETGNVTAAVTPTAAKIGPEAPPKFLPPKFERMPAELKLLKNWLLWVSIWNGSKWTKRPIQVSGFGASTTNPKHWSSFDDVKQAYKRGVERGYIELREKDEPAQRLRHRRRRVRVRRPAGQRWARCCGG